MTIRAFINNGFHTNVMIFKDMFILLFKNTIVAGTNYLHIVKINAFF